MIRIRRLFLAVLALSWVHASHGQSQRDMQVEGRSICIDPTRNLPQTGGTLVLDWQDMMCLEHNARARLMKRIAARYPADRRPQFSEFIVGKDRLPEVFRRDVPLLRVVFPESSFFDTASAKVRPDAIDALLIIAEGLRGQSPDVAMFVVGHTDDRGGTDYNYNLSVDRSASVAATLKGMGIGPIAIWRVGFGEAVPLVPNDTTALMAVNRRVEFIFGARADPVAVWLEQEQPDYCVAPGHARTTACKRRLPPRPVIATAETRNTLVESNRRSATPPKADRRRGQSVTDKKRSIDPGGQMPDELRMSDSARRHVELIAPNRMVLRMVPQQRRMAKPTRF